MKKKIYLFILHILGVIGLIFSIDWVLIESGVVDRKYMVRESNRVIVGFSGIDDQIEIYNYSEGSSLDKSIVVIVDNEILSVTNIQGIGYGNKLAEVVFSTFNEGDRVRVVHHDRDGVPSHRMISPEGEPPRKEFLSQIVWSKVPVEVREELILDDE